MACTSGGDISNEDVVVTQWLDPSHQNKVEHNNSNLVLFEVEYVQGQDGLPSDQVLAARGYSTYSHAEPQSFDINDQIISRDINGTDFHGAPPTAEHLDSAPPRNIPTPHLEGGESFYPHSSSHAPSPPLPLQYTQFTTDAFSSSDILLSSEQCAEMLKSGVKLELVLPNGSLAYGVMEPVTKSINVQIPNDVLHSLRPQHVQVAIDMDPDNPVNTEVRRFDPQLHMSDDALDESNVVARRFESQQQLRGVEDVEEGQRYVTSEGLVETQQRYDISGALSDRRRYELDADRRRYDHLSDRLSDVVTSRIESHFRGEIDMRRLREAEYESDQLDNQVEAHNTFSRNFESPQTEIRYESVAHVEKAEFEDRSFSERNFEHVHTERGNFEQHPESRNFDTVHTQRDSRPTPPLDCSTSLNAIDHRLEEIRIIQESLEEDSLEPSLLEDGILSRLDTECLLSICDKPVPSRAKATLPASFLYFSSVPDCADEVVYARRRIPKFSRFGPVEGILIDEVISSYELEVKRETLNLFSELFFLIEVEPGRYRQLDVSDQEASNWMRFVRPARSVQEQNLTLHQKGNAIYFTSIKDVRVKQELRVWYSQDYAHKRCLPFLEPQSSVPSYISDILSGRLDRSEKCPHCDDYFTKEDLREHIISVHNAPCQSVEPPSQKPPPPPPLVRITHKEDRVDEFDRDFCQKKVRISERIASQKHGTSRMALPPEPVATSVAEPTILQRQESGEEDDNTSYTAPLSKRKTHECTTCRKAFPKGFNLKRHILSHLPEQRFPCEFCGKVFTQELYRDKHIRNCHSQEEVGVSLLPSPPIPDQDGAWVCSKCEGEVKFDSFSTYLMHVQAHDNEPGDNDENRNIDEHEGPSHQCPQCPCTYNTREQTLRHIISVHSHREKNLRVCELCARGFHTAEALERHKSMANDTSLPYRCVKCCKRFNTAIALQGHVRIHGHPTFQCPMCEKAFESLQWMRNHVKTHLINGFYHCPRCPKKFQEYQVIRKHIRTFHSDRQFGCQMCSKVFPSQDKLRMHMLSHSDHREFLCANCGKQFKRKDKLKEHMVRQHNPDENQILDQDQLKEDLRDFMPTFISDEIDRKKKISPLTDHSDGNQAPSRPSGGGGGGRSDYAKALYKCHPCLVGFKRRGMLVNHLAARHPDIRPESVPELSMPILKTARDYYCQYCDKIYKSSSKRKSHILKNHPGQALPLSNRMKLGRSDSDELPNPSFCQTVGSISATPQQCQWCHKQYASKAKLLQHQRKKHHEQLPPDLRVPRLSKQSSSEDDTGRAVAPPHPPAAPTPTMTHHVQDMTSHMTFDVKSAGLSSDLLPLHSFNPNHPPSLKSPPETHSSSTLTRKPSIRPRLMKQDRVQEDDIVGGVVSGGGTGSLVEIAPEVYELTTELCPETLELLRKQFKQQETSGDTLGHALDDKTLSTEQLLKLFALNGVTIVTEQTTGDTNYAVFTPYPPR
uniref:PR domain zinc finger protein 10 n=1 Tax=Cacopsylla melanoneura TaxID=428564 RepID=A0A8D8UET7_9HEMI